MSNFYPSTFCRLMGYQKFNKAAFRGYLGSKFLNLKIGEKTFQETYLPAGKKNADDVRQNRFSTPSDPVHHSLINEDPQLLAEGFSSELLKKMVSEAENHGYAGKPDWTSILEGNNTLVQPESVCLEDLKACHTDGDRFLVLLLYSMFQNTYESCAHPKIYRYLTENTSTPAIAEKPVSSTLSGDIPDKLLRYGSEDAQRELFHKPMFLEMNGTNGKTLRETYVVPDYCVGTRQVSVDNDKYRKHNLKTYLKALFDDEEGNCTTGLILGGPGIGKSTLFSWILNWDDIKKPGKKKDLVYAGTEGNRRIYLYRFNEINTKLKWSNEDTDGKERLVSGGEVLQQFLRFLSLSREPMVQDLNGAILLLDGFDECSATESQRYEFLKELSEQWGEYCRILITCRYGYIMNPEKLPEQIETISLQSFGREQITEFICRYHGLKNEQLDEQRQAVEEQVQHMMDVSHTDNTSDDNELLHLLSDDVDDDQMKEAGSVFGIPIVLYMVLAMSVPVERADSVCRIYDQIFKKEGGIYDRMLNRSYDVIKGGDVFKKIQLSTPERQYAFKQYLSDISKEIALYIFEQKEYKSVDKDEVQAYLKKREKKHKEDGKVLTFRNDSGRVIDLGMTLSSGLFMYVDAPKQNGNGSSLRFVHKSIYEYFMALSLFEASVTYEEEYQTDPYQAEKHAHKAFADLLKRNRLSNEILTMWLWKLTFWKEKDEDMEEALCGFLTILESLFAVMLNRCMTAELVLESNHDTAAERRSRETMESNIFCNMCYLLQSLHILIKQNMEFDKSLYLFQDNRDILDSFPEYLRKVHYKNWEGNAFYLSEWNLSGMRLDGINLSGYDLSKALAVKTSFRGCNMKFCDLTGADLRGAAFTDADLYESRPNAWELFGSDTYSVPFTRVKGMVPDPDGLYTRQEGTLNGQTVRKGSIVTFGNYKQDNEVEKTPIEWRVLEVRNNRALLFAERILDAVPYNQEFETTNWEACFLQKWLNSEESYKKDRGFLDEAFTEKEQKQICLTLVEPNENIKPTEQQFQEEAVVAKIFLLSGQELVQYFAEEGIAVNYGIDRKKLIGIGTKYANERGLSKNYPWWWLRSVSGGGRSALNIGSGGGVWTNGNDVNYVDIDDTGVRPALWVNLES